MSTRLEDEVREALRISAETLATPPDAYVRVMSTVTADRRRRRAIVAGSGIASMLLAWMVGLSAGLLDREPRTSTPATEQITDHSPDWGLQANWPARGELAMDAEFGEEFALLHGGNHRLLYAEDGDAGRVVIAVSAGQEAVVFHGPAGAEVSELQRTPGLPVDTRDVAVAVPEDDGHLIIVVMPEHLQDVQIGLPTVVRDGSVARSWRRIPVADGVARVVISDPIEALRIRTPAGDGPPHVVVGNVPPWTPACGRCDGDWFAREGVAQFRDQSAAVVGVAAEDVTAHVLLDVAVSDGRVVSLVATLPSGGLLRAAYLVTPGAGPSTVSIAEPLRPLPAGDEARPILIASGTASGSAGSAGSAGSGGDAGAAVIVAPAASRIAFTALGDAAPVADAILTDGVADVSIAPGDLKGYRLTAYDSDGTARRTWHGSVLQAVDPFQVFDPRWTGRTG